MALVENFSTAHGTALQGQALFEHFNNRAPRYSKQCEAAHWSGPNQIVDILRTDLSRPGAKILLLGSGDAEEGTLIKKINPNSVITAVDGAEKMLDIALEKKAIDKKIVGDLEDFESLGLESEEYNAVLMSGVIDFIRNTPQLARGIVRTLKPGEPFAITYQPLGSPHAAPNALLHDSAQLKQLFLREAATIEHDDPFVAWYSEKMGITAHNNLLIGHKAKPLTPAGNG
jgi:ubiquinone/menaquinone biosynthesis C-methylase UbiE